MSDMRFLSADNNDKETTIHLWKADGIKMWDLKGAGLRLGPITKMDFLHNDYKDKNLLFTGDD